MVERVLKREVTQEEVDQLYSDKDVFALLFENDEPTVAGINPDNKSKEQTNKVTPDKKGAPSVVPKMLSQEDMLKRFQTGKKSDATKSSPTSATSTPKATKVAALDYMELPLSKTKKKAGQNIIGLDIGYDSVKLAFLPPGMNKVILDSEEIIGSNGETLNEQGTVEAIQNLFSRNSIKKKEVVACFSERYLFLRVITLVQMNQKELEQALFFEAKKHHIPFTIDNAIVRYSILREIKDHTGIKNEILLAAAPQRIPDAIHSVLRRAGLKPVAIDFGSMAALRVLNLRYTCKKNSVGVLLNVGNNKTLVTILKGNEFLWAKDIAIGRRLFVETIADYLMLSIPKAEEIMKKENDFKVIEAMQPIFDQLILELSRVLEYVISVHNSGDIHQMLFCGHAANIPGMKKVLTEHFDIPITNIEPKISVHSQKKSATIGPEYLTAAGLTLWNKKGKDINLLPATSSKSSISFSLPQIKILSTLFTLLTVILLLSPLVGIPVYMTMKINPLKKDIARYRALINDFSDIQNKLDKQMMVRNQLDKKKKEIENLKKESQRLSAPLAEFSKILPKNVSILSVTFINKKFTVKGLVKKNSTLETFFKNLKNSTYFDRVSNVIVKKTLNLAPYKFSFNISFYLAGR